MGTFSGGRKAQGKLTYTNGDYFDGTFDNGAYVTGKIKLHYSNGDYFEGTLSNSGWDTGYGETYGETTVYKGYWKNGRRNGQGTLFCGYWIYVGNFKDGKQHGSGRERWPKEKRKNYASELECNYVNDKREGLGVWYFNDHTYRKCLFKNGKEVKTIEEGTWK